MKTSDFHFTLPVQLIAQYPLEERTASKMLVYHRDTEQIKHTQFKRLPEHLKAGDVLVMNDSKVIPARFFGQKATGGHVEFLLERLLSPTVFLAHIRASKSPKPGAVLKLVDGTPVTVRAKQHHLYECVVEQPILSWLETLGHVPLPPYIQRPAENSDKQRYQTVYAKEQGSVAAPTAGLHFDETMLNTLTSMGVQFAFTTLHVGAGTFQPVRSVHIADHQMHAEWMEVSAETCQIVNQAKDRGQRVIAVGSTALRALESAAVAGKLEPYSGETRIFITPGYSFQIIDGLMTNFHLPESTLLMMVAALVGHQQWMKLYQEAVKEAYRFFSYGDVSLLL